MYKSVRNILAKLGFKSKKEQLVIISLLAIIFIGFLFYQVGLNIGEFIAHIQNSLS